MVRDYLILLSWLCMVHGKIGEDCYRIGVAWVGVFSRGKEVANLSLGMDDCDQTDVEVLLLRKSCDDEFLDGRTMIVLSIGGDEIFRFVTGFSTCRT